MSRLGTIDAIVVGLGAMGSAVTLRLAERGVRVIGLDRYAPPHTLGSTHGETRITRLAIGEGHEYVPLVRRSHELWRQIERATGSSLLQQTGGIVLASRDDAFLAHTRAAAQRYAIGHENLTAVELRRRFPMFAVSDDTEAYLEPEAGFVRPEAAVRAQLGLARDAGAELRFGEAVREWTSGPAGVAVHTTSGGTYEASKVVFCAGAWIRELVPGLAGLFAVYPQLLHWFPIRQGHAQLQAMPVFIWETGGAKDEFAHGTGFYGFPAIDGPGGGVKLATERYDATAGPGDPRSPGLLEAADFHRRLLAERFPWVGPEPLRVVSCLYTNTRGSRFVIDRLGAHPHVMVVAACSGHGFKHSAAIGEAVAQQLVDGRSEIDLTPFALPPSKI